MARALYGRRRHDREAVAEELRRWQAPEEVVSRALARPGEAIEVHADNWQAVAVFAALGTQWRRAGLAGIATGLDYQAIRPTAELLGITPTPDLFAALRVMEAEALAVMREEARDGG